MSEIQQNISFLDRIKTTSKDLFQIAADYPKISYSVLALVAVASVGTFIRSEPAVEVSGSTPNALDRDLESCLSSALTGAVGQDAQVDNLYFNGTIDDIRFDVSASNRDLYVTAYHAKISRRFVAAGSIEDGTVTINSAHVNDRFTEDRSTNIVSFGDADISNRQGVVEVTASPSEFSSNRTTTSVFSDVSIQTNHGYISINDNQPEQALIDFARLLSACTTSAIERYEP